MQPGETLQNFISERNRTMINKTWQGYYISKRARDSEFHHYVKSIYKGEITWTTDYTYAKHYSEKTAKRLDVEIEESLLNGTCNNEFIIADSEVENEPETVEDTESEDKTMDNKAFAELASNRMMLEELKQIVADQEEAIKAQSVAEGITEYIGTEHKASYKTFEERRFDSTAFRKDHADMYEAYRKPQMKSRFTFA